MTWAKNSGVRTMDELHKRLRRDAEQLQAGTSPEMRLRLEASLSAARDARTMAVKRPEPAESSQGSAWWLSAITGVAAVLLVVFLISRGSLEETGGEAVSLNNHPPAEASDLPEDWFVTSGLDLNIQPADLTRSLEEELTNLQSDLVKARQNVERDVKFAF
jgi:hypothetical protein